MQWIKSHLNVVIAGSVSLLALVALVLGVVLNDVAAGMSQDVGLISQLQSPSGLPGSALLDLRRQQLERHAQLVTELAQAEKKLSGDHKPLPVAKDIFPKENPANQNAPFEFKRDYRKAQQDLLTMLKAQDKPSELEIAEELQKIKRLQAQEAVENAQPGQRVNPVTPGPLQRGNAFGPGPVQGGPGSTKLPPDATPQQRVAQDENARAAVAKAHRKGYWCYAALSSLDQRPSITENEQRPVLDDMWYAQVALWIQEDVLSALAKLNTEYAEANLPNEADRWVGNMPFKHLLNFTVGGYVPPAVEGQSGNFGGPSSGMFDSMGGIGGPPPMSAGAVMSKNGCSDTVDVLQFTLEIVVEARALPRVLDKISESGFYTVLQVNYETVPPNIEMYDYIYGAKPALRVWLLCEGSLLRTNESYASLMPETVKADIKSGRPVGGGSPASGGGMGPGYGPPRGPMMPGGRGDPRFGGGRGDPRFGGRRGGSDGA